MSGRLAFRRAEKVSEELCIRFVNTVAWRLHSPVEERLPEASALLEWLGAAGLTDKPHVARLKSDFAGHPDQAKDFHRRAVELREAIYQLLRPQRSAKKLPRKALKVLNAVLNENTSNLRLARQGTTLVWHFVGVAELLRPIAWSAADLLMGSRAGRIHQCEDDRGCGWLFVDESRAQNRRWCSMEECGNRAKAQRHYGRRLQPGAPFHHP